ncbi:MAG: carbohydrate ABC transporter permease [Chloroflexi bacterium]|nr:carbohydrate ABC transporter permease [Chloroflexota bacterium]
MTDSLIRDVAAPAGVGAATGGAAGRWRARVPWKGIAIYTVAILFSLFIVLPFSWIILTSFMYEVDAIVTPPMWIPERLTLDNYLAFFRPELLRNNQLAGGGAAQMAPRALLNSTIVAVSVALINIVVGSLAAYPIARFRFPGSAALVVFYLGSRMVPPIAIMIALYALVRQLGLLDTVWALILTYATFTVPYSVWILQSYFRTIPRDLEDAARVDRCNWFSMMVRVFLPVASPGLVACAMFAFLASWGEFLYALVLTTTINSKTMPMIVAQFTTDVDTSPVVLSAGGVLAVLPPLILALIFQRLIVSGIAAGSVKG